MTAITEAPPTPTPKRAAARRSHPMARFLVRRVAAGIAVLLVMSVLVFIATSVIPGDAASAILGRQATDEQLAALRREMGIDRPLTAQYLHWFGGMLSGDLGNSAAGYAAGGEVSIWSQIGAPLADSAVLAISAFLPVVVLSMLLGVFSALRAGRWQDHLISTSTLVPSALPEFVFGAVLLGVFFSLLGLLPPVSLITPGQSPLATPELLLLPVMTIVGVCLGPCVRMIRAGMIEALAADSVAVARLNGIGESRVVWRYALRNALAPSIQVLALTAQYLMGGLLIVEYLFSYPGIGKKLVEAVTSNDNLQVQSITMVLAAIYVGITIAADLAVTLVVPKLRTGGAL